MSYQIPAGLVVFSAPSCPKCDVTKRQLKEQNRTFTEINIREVADAADLLRSMGFRSLPVIFEDGNHITI